MDGRGEGGEEFLAGAQSAYHVHSGKQSFSWKGSSAWLAKAQRACKCTSCGFYGIKCPHDSVYFASCPSNVLLIEQNLESREISDSWTSTTLVKKLANPNRAHARYFWGKSNRSFSMIVLLYQEQARIFTENSNFWKRNSRISNVFEYSKIRVLIANDENWSIGMNTKRRGRERGSLNPTLIRNNRNVCRYPVENTRARSGKKENRERIGKVGGESPGFRYRRDLSVPYFEFKRLTPRIHGCRMQNTDSRWW